MVKRKDWTFSWEFSRRRGDADVRDRRLCLRRERLARPGGGPAPWEIPSALDSGTRSVLVTLALRLAGPQSCNETRQDCRACSTIDGKRRCSNVGIAYEIVGLLQLVEVQSPTIGPARQSSSAKLT